MPRPQWGLPTCCTAPTSAGSPPRSPDDRIPRHVGVILDGNRRWAREAGDDDRERPPGRARTRSQKLLGWCDEVGVEVVTLWLLSTDNLRRAASELAPLLRHHRGRRRRASPPTGRWRVHPMGALDLLPDETAAVAEGARPTRTADVDGLIVNVAVGYGGRREIADAVRVAAARARRAAARRSRSWPRSSTSSTSPSTSTPRASPTPTW